MDNDTELLVHSVHTLQDLFGGAISTISNERAREVSGISQLLPGTLSLVAQVGSSGASAALLVLLHIGSPECCAHSVREVEEDTGNGNELE